MQYQKEALEGVELMWANKFEQAEEIFAKHKTVSPRHALLYAEVMFFRAILTELVEDRKEATSRFERAIALGEEHVRAYNDNKIPKGVEADPDQISSYSLDAHVVTADGYTILSTLQMIEEQRIKGLLNLRRGWRTYKEILAYAIGNDAIDPVAVNTLKFGAGLFYFLISFVPPGLAQKAAQLAGFSGGDKQLGLEYLRSCHNSTSIRSHLAGLVLALNHLFMTIPYDEEAAPAALKEVETIVQEGIDKFSTGSLFYLFGGIAHLEKNQTDKAKEYFTKAIENAKPIVEYPALCMRLTVNCYTMRFDWASAAETINLLIAQEQKHKSKYAWSTTWNAIRLGSCYAALGEKDKSEVHLKVAANQKGNDNWSNQLRLQANKFLRMYPTFSIFELMIVTGHFQKVLNNNTDEKRNEILAMIEKMGAAAPGAQKPLSDIPKPTSKGYFSSMFSKKDVTNDVNADNRAFYLLLKSYVLLSLKNYSGSEVCTQEIIDNNALFANDKIYHMLALINHARSIAPTRREEAAEEIKQVMKQSGFVWENSVKTNARRLLEQLGGGEVVDDRELTEEEIKNMALEEAEAEEETQE